MMPARVPEGDVAPVGDDDIRSEAEQLGQAILDEGLPIRLMGGMAVWLRCPSVRRPPFQRDYADIDLIASSRNRRGAEDFLKRRGYLPERLFNAIHGRDRLNFSHPSGRWTIDVVFDELRMSHRIDLRGRLNGQAPTIDLADLLLTKLQIWEINEKDLGDALCIVADHPVLALTTSGSRKDLQATDPDAIDLRRIASLCGGDWGLCHTVQRNLGLLRDLSLARSPGGSSQDPALQVGLLLEAIDEAPKTLGWRSRARIGERVRWYETPEEVRH
jgi:hypothetical protein